MKQLSISCIFFAAFFAVTTIQAADIGPRVADISYYETPTDDYQRSQCKLDIYAPENAKKLPVLVWFHGGGLTGGNKKEVQKSLKNDKLVLVAVGYRLSPQGTFPACLEDAAAATAWTIKNIDRYGGDPKRVVVGGYSAGGYLSAMVGMDPRWLKSHGITTNQIAGLVLLSGQVSTHFHVKELMQPPIPQHRIVIDDYAPLRYASDKIPPILMTLGDRKIEWPTRVEENELLAASLRSMKHPHVEFYENAGYDHGTIGNTKGDLAPEAANQIFGFLQKTVDFEWEKK